MGNLEQSIIRNTKRAIYEYEMIQDGDIIVLGVSGGKDSMLLGYILSELRKEMKEKFEIRGVYVFKEFLIDCDIQFEEKRKYYKEVLGIELEKVNVSLPKESKLNNGIGQSCQWCAYSRRIAMMKLCKQWGAKKICFGHHLDDIVTTTFMNLSQGRSLRVMPPVNKMSQGELTFIRPFMYVREADILKLVKDKGIPYSPCSCPVGETTMRNKIKNELWAIEKKIPNFIENTFYGFIRDFNEKHKDGGFVIGGEKI